MMLKLQGITSLSEVLLWPSNPSVYSVCTDIMHMHYLNIFKDEFELISKTFSSKRRSFWTDLSREYKKYVQLNGINGFYDFTSFETWKGMCQRSQMRS